MYRAIFAILRYAEDVGDSLPIQRIFDTMYLELRALVTNGRSSKHRARIQYIVFHLIIY